MTLVLSLDFFLIMKIKKKLRNRLAIAQPILQLSTRFLSECLRSFYAKLNAIQSICFKTEQIFLCGFSNDGWRLIEC